MKNELIVGGIGTALSAVGTATQTQEILQIVSLIITILGGVISFIVLPILNWYQKAKKDGKITVDEIKEGVETLQDGIEKTKEEIEKEQNKNAGQRKD